VLTISTGGFEEYMEITGPIEPLRGTDLAAEETGAVTAIPHDKGSLVEKGATIVRIDRDLLGAEKRMAVADSTLAAYNEDRTRNLFDANSVSGQEMLQATVALEKASAGAVLARLRHDRAATSAPYDGMITQRYVELGEHVTAGTPVARVVDPYTLKLRASVTERQVHHLLEGASVTVHAEGIPHVLKGQVAWVGFEAAQATGKFPVEIHLDNPDLLVRPGVVARARILTDRHDDVVVAPRDAILEGRDGTHVFVVEDDHARRRDVVLGPDHGALVMVTEGLSPGDQLVVRGHRDLSPDARVAVQEETRHRDGTISTDPRAIREDRAPGGEVSASAGSGGDDR
jgi:RND family efflux transporter MFP subunit